MLLFGPLTQDDLCTEKILSRAEASGIHRPLRSAQLVYYSGASITLASEMLTAAAARECGHAEPSAR